MIMIMIFRLKTQLLSEREFTPYNQIWHKKKKQKKIVANGTRLHVGTKISWQLSNWYTENHNQINRIRNPKNCHHESPDQTSIVGFQSQIPYPNFRDHFQSLLYIISPEAIFWHHIPKKHDKTHQTPFWPKRKNGSMKLDDGWQVMLLSNCCSDIPQILSPMEQQNP
jgi:hypothetical protein